MVRVSPDIRRERSDAELLTAHVAGDPYAFAELFTRHRHRLYRLARRRSHCPEDAADALQDAMLAAHRGAAAFRHQAAVGSWLHRIVVNVCLDRRRRNAVSIRLETALGVEAHPMDDGTARVDAAIVVHRALRRLPVEQRAAIVAVDIDGYSVADAAELLGIAEGTVKSRRSRGRARLAVVLGRHEGGAEDLAS
jgi:RNA polymerase sigma-70 factor (ECF subfamily)